MSSFHPFRTLGLQSAQSGDHLFESTRPIRTRAANADQPVINAQKWSEAFRRETRVPA
jgi:hypothetical protein